MPVDVSAYIADLQNAVDQGRLGLDRDRFNQIELPTYQNINLPTSIGRNTGFLPSGYVGGYGGMATWDALTGAAEQMGTIGATVDPRLAALGYGAGQRTLGGRELDLRGDQLRAEYEHRDREFAAGRSDADRAFAEAQRARFDDQQRQDADLALRMNVDPRTVIGGQVVPEYLAPHAEWARTFYAQNQGRLPGYQDLVKALAQSGRVPEDYNGGQPYPGQVPAAGPGIVFDPQRGYVDTVTGQPMSKQEAAAVVQTRQGQSSVITGFDANGTPMYALRDGVGAAPLGAQGDGRVQGGPALAYQGPALAGGAAGGPTQRGGPALAYAGGQYAGPGAPAGSATAAIGRGAAMSLEQRQLIEAGRGTDVRAGLEQRSQDLQNQWTTNQQRIAEEENLRQGAIAQGNLDLAREHETNVNGLQQRAQALQERAQAFKEEADAAGLTGSFRGSDTLAKGDLTGFLNGAATLETGRALGNIAGQATLEREALYGGAGNVGGGQTLAAQTAYGGAGLVGGGLTLEAQQALGRVGGAQTLAAQQEAARQAEAAGRAAGGGLTLAAQEARGYVGGASTLGREQMENQTALQYLSQAADLSRNPADWVRYSTMLGGTPRGIRDIVDASAGRFNMARFGDYGTGSGGMASVGSVAAGAGNAPGEIAAAQSRLAAPNQIAPQQYQKMNATQRAMLGGLYESGPNAVRATDVDEMYRRSLPKYGGPRAGRMVA